jgi:hypothetical protein
MSSLSIKQKHYGQLEVDPSETDVVQIWLYQNHSINVVQIEREYLQDVINKLQEEVNNG